MDYKYKFSIIVPIYNVEKYIAETIDSIINQSLGFKDNIQLILVNDGSKDKSEEICLKYKNLYPENIIYLKKENGGVSSARNIGIDYINGQYVNFLDGDDKWESDSLEKIYDFFEKNKSEIDFVVARKELFEAKDGFHILDYKFEKTKIVDIFEDYNFVQMDVTSVAIKTEVVKNIKFNEKLKYAEDADFINRVLLLRKKYGVIREAIHFYRKRLDDTSALQKASYSKSWFIDTIEYFHKEIINNSLNLFGKVIPYIQYVIMYDLQWRIKRNNCDILNEKEKNDYIRNIIDLLKKIDDRIIIEQKNIHSKYKLYALSLKYGKDITNELEFKDGSFYYNGLEVYKIKNKKNVLVIEDINVNDKQIYIKGKSYFAIPIYTYEIFYNTNLNFKTKIELNEDKNIITFKGDILKTYFFNIEIPCNDINNISFLFKYKQNEEYDILIGLCENIKSTNSNIFKSENKKYKIVYNPKYINIKKIRFKDRVKNILKKLKKI